MEQKIIVRLDKFAIRDPVWFKILIIRNVREMKRGRCIYISSAGKTSHYRECPPMKETEIIIALLCVFELKKPAAIARFTSDYRRKLNRKKSIRSRSAQRNFQFSSHEII